MHSAPLTREKCGFVVAGKNIAWFAVYLRLTGGDVVINVRLTRKLAARMDGVDVSKVKVGDVLELPDEQAMRMVKSGWAERVAETKRLKAARGKRKAKN